MTARATSGGRAWLRLLLLAVVLGAAAVWWWQQQQPAEPSPGRLQSEQNPSRAHVPDRDGGLRTVVDNAVVKSYGKVVYRGRVDLGKSIARIKAGERHPHRNDGSVFRNRERRLPDKPRGYYREYVHPTSGIRGAGPQRLVVGQGGEWYYTPDHYKSFVPLHRRRLGPRALPRPP